MRKTISIGVPGESAANSGPSDATDLKTVQRLRRPKRTKALATMGGVVKAIRQGSKVAYTHPD
jgi:hypothetical protein